MTDDSKKDYFPDKHLYDASKMAKIYEGIMPSSDVLKNLNQLHDIAVKLQMPKPPTNEISDSFKIARTMPDPKDTYMYKILQAQNETNNSISTIASIEEQHLKAFEASETQSKKESLKNTVGIVLMTLTLLVSIAGVIISIYLSSK